MFKRYSFKLWAWCLISSFSVATASARAEGNEYQLKAACLLHFVEFTDWPSNAFLAEGAPLCIGVLGDDPFGSVLEQTLGGETVHSRKLTVKRSQRVEDLADCQMVFVSKSEHSHWSEILPKLVARPVVSVSEVPGFAKEGGTINFYLDQKKLRFEINPTLARERGLKMSSQLLGMAKIVDSPH